jgi:multiple sugar transport system substrate-binding protein/sn-glycerol 3-phosphate transport system substrate-binding protein
VKVIFVIIESFKRSVSDTRDYITSLKRGAPKDSTYLVILFLSLILLAACSSGPPPTGTEVFETQELAPSLTSTSTTTQIPPTSTATPSPTSSIGLKPSDLNGLRLTFWHPWSGETARAVQESIDEFNSLNAFGISVEGISKGTIDVLYEDIDSAESAVLPNLSLGANYQIQSWISGGKPVTGLNAFVDDPEWGLSAEEQSDFYRVFLEQDINDQNRFGFPAVRTAPLLFYNSTWAKELGFSSPPSTTPEFMEQACAAARANSSNDFPEDDGTGGWLIDTTPSGVLSWIYAFGSSVTLTDGSGYQFSSPQTANSFEFLKDLFDQGCAWELLESPAEVEFANRRALFITGSLGDINYQAAELDRADKDDSWTVIGFPSPSGEAVIDVYGPSYVIFAGTPQENLAAWLVIKWLSSSEQGAKISAARGTFPIRASALEYLDSYANENPQWAAAQELLTVAQSEPGFESWKVVRWILGDVGTQIFRYYFTPDRIPATLELMDETAAELHALPD